MTPKEFRDAWQVNNDRQLEILDKAKAESRDLTDAENAEMRQLERDMKKLHNDFMLESAPKQDQFTLANADEELRRAKAGKYDVSVVLERSITTTAAVEGTGIIPVSEQAVMKPLEAGLIWGKLGIPVQSGLAGEIRWPYHGKATATWEDETSQLVDGSIDFSALTMTGKRLGVAIPVSRTALEDSRSNIIENAVLNEMPMTCQRLINNAMLTIYGEYKDTDTTIKEKAVAGPFAQYANTPAKNCKTYDFGANITRKGLLDMKAEVAGTGVTMTAPAWVVNEATKAALEDTKVDAGSGRFVCENDKILGYPVLTSNEVADGIVLFGDWSYQAAGFFGTTSMVIDPYTLARRFSTDFVLNMRFGTARLRKEAFILGRTNAAKTEMTTKLTGLTIPAQTD